MQSLERYLTRQIRHDLGRKMVFVAGPRQVGKTTLALHITRSTKSYLNWDVAAHREKILMGEMPPTQLWILDEIHKYRRWRNYLKGLYDGRREGQQILVTGSARLDLYRFGGDSLQGRYHMLRLHPLSIAELGITTRRELTDLLVLGGFPEPFLAGSKTEARRWSREYRSRLISEDIASLERIQDLGQLELLMLRLPALTGSPLSINALREDLQVSHKAVSGWMDALERLYAIFRLNPFGAPHIRAIKKARKHYHLDWTLVADDGARFENLVACHLLKWVHYRQDAQGDDLDIHYFRDTDGREVDFVISDRGVPIKLVECKWSDSGVDRSLRYLHKIFPHAEAWQITATGKKDYLTPDGIRVAPALELLGTLV